MIELLFQAIGVSILLVLFGAACYGMGQSKSKTFPNWYDYKDPRD